MDKLYSEEQYEADLEAASPEDKLRWFDMIADVKNVCNGLMHQIMENFKDRATDGNVSDVILWAMREEARALLVSWYDAGTSIDEAKVDFAAEVLEVQGETSGETLGYAINFNPNNLYTFMLMCGIHVDAQILGEAQAYESASGMIFVYIDGKSACFPKDHPMSNFYDLEAV